MFIEVNKNEVNRYKDTVVLIRDNDLPNTYSTYKKAVLKDDIKIKAYHKVTEAQRNRLDMIAYEHYMDAQLWWLIAMANDIIDPFFIPPGITLRIPYLSEWWSADKEE